MAGVIIFLIIVIIAAVCIGLAFAESNSTAAGVVVPANKEYKYSEHEYIELYNYCVRKRNAIYNQLAGTYGIFPIQSLNKKIANMDEVLDNTTQAYKSPYITDDYTQWCRSLLTLLDNDEKQAINYGMLDSVEIT